MQLPSAVVENVCSSLRDRAVVESPFHRSDDRLGDRQRCAQVQHGVGRGDRVVALGEAERLERGLEFAVGDDLATGFDVNEHTIDGSGGGRTGGDGSVGGGSVGGGSVGGGSASSGSESSGSLGGRRFCVVTGLRHHETERTDQQDDEGDQTCDEKTALLLAAVVGLASERRWSTGWLAAGTAVLGPGRKPCGRGVSQAAAFRQRVGSEERDWPRADSQLPAEAHRGRPRERTSRSGRRAAPAVRVAAPSCRVAAPSGRVGGPVGRSTVERSSTPLGGRRSGRCGVASASASAVSSWDDCSGRRGGSAGWCPSGGVGLAHGPAH